MFVSSGLESRVWCLSAGIFPTLSQKRKATNAGEGGFKDRDLYVRQRTGTEITEVRMLGAGSPALHPSFDQGPELLLRSRSRSSPDAGLPAPTHKRIFGHVVHYLPQALSAIPTGILNLDADLAERLAGPGHLDGCQMPGRMPWHAT
jgi:hypothetical protein